jgi:hypothetical protein
MLESFFTGPFQLLAYLPMVGLAFLIFKYRDRKLQGPIVNGTAEVLSLKVASWVVGNPGSGWRPCTIGLRVNVPGRAPYDVTIRQKIDSLTLRLCVAPGRSVPVTVEEANPQHVRIDFTQDAQPPMGSRGAGRVVINTPPRITVNQPTAMPSAPNLAVASVLSAADLLASGQRVSGVLKSFSPTGTTPRSLGRTPSRPELIDAPHYMVEVELRVPNLTPVTARSVQAVPIEQVPRLTMGLMLSCAVDPADPAHRWAVDWAQMP